MIRTSIKARVGIAIALAIVLAGGAVRGWFGAAKKTFHIDEGYSAALTNGKWVPGTDTAERDRWLDGDRLFAESFIDALAERGASDDVAIYKATALDVHPPLYYWVFARARILLGVQRFAFAGYAMNMLFYVLSAALVALVAFRATRDWGSTLLALSIFVFSSTTISLTLFIRMYELLQFLCLAFLASALLVLYPTGEGRARVVSCSFGVVGLAAFAFLGLMTQYYFLFFVAPVAAVCLVVLVAQRRVGPLFWAILATVAGLYLAYRAFPEMRNHLTKSYRAKQSLKFLSKAGMAERLTSLWAFARIVSANLVPFVALAALAVLAVVERVRKTARSARAGHERALLAISLAVFAFTFVVISLSAPYRTSRYLGAFFPVYGLAFVLLSRALLSDRGARVLVGAAALLVLVHGIQPKNVNEFHEDYTLDADPFYMRGDTPLVVFATPEGASWKNILPYLNVGKGKRVYVAYAKIGESITARLSAIAKSSGSSEVYALVDDYFKNKPNFDRVGYYAFYDVYRVPGE